MYFIDADTVSVNFKEKNKYRDVSWNHQDTAKHISGHTAQCYHTLDIDINVFPIIIHPYAWTPSTYVGHTKQMGAFLL